MTTLEAPPVRMTAEELLEMPGGENYELLDGQLKETWVSVDSSWIGGEIYGRLREFVRSNDLGWVYPPDIQLHIWRDRPRLVRKADAAYLSRERAPGGRPRGGYLEVASDLVVEVTSTHDEAEAIETNRTEYLAAGVRLVWIVFPTARTAHVYRADGSAAVVVDGQELDGEDVLPGLRMTLSEVLPPEGVPPSP